MRANESLTIIRRLLEGESVTFSGLEFDISDARIKPKPREPIPILVGGRSDAAFERAAKHSEGWIGVWCSAKRYAEALGILAEKAEEFGRNQVDWSHGYQPWIGIDKEDSKKARMAKKKVWRVSTKSLFPSSSVIPLLVSQAMLRNSSQLMQRQDAVCLT